MYKISDFSKKTGISIETLRYYDKIDFFKPLYTDIFSGYRYYIESQSGNVGGHIDNRYAHRGIRRYMFSRWTCLQPKYSLLLSGAKFPHNYRIMSENRGYR